MSRKFHSHAYPVSRKEALEIGLPVNKQRDPVLEKMMWDVWLNVEAQLKERIWFDPTMELLNSKQASKLLSPVPQLKVPPGANFASNFNTGIEQILANSQDTTDAVDFEYENALVESPRLAFRNVTKGKILGCRAPDLLIKYNRMVSSLEWEEEKP